MRRNTFFAGLAAAVALFAAGPEAPLGLAGDAFAQEERKAKTRRVPTMTEATYKKLAEVQEFMDAKDYDGAIKVLDDMMERSRRYNGNEIGQIYNMYAFAYYSKDDLPRAIQAYERVLAQGEDITEGLELSTLDNLSKFHFMEENFKESLRYTELWMEKTGDPAPNAYIFLGQVHYQLADFPSAIDAIERGVALAQQRGLEVKENWWSLLRYLYFEREDWDNVLRILEILVRDFPKRDYWLQLAGVYGQQGFEKKLMYCYEAAHAAGFINRERDLINYVGLMMQEQVPYRAAVRMQASVSDELVESTSRNLQQLGQAYQLSQETDKAIPVYERAGAESEDGEILGRLAALYLENDQFEKCSDAAERALTKGGLHNELSTKIVRGQCDFNRDRLTSARRVFVDVRSEARREKNRSVEQMAARWITYIDSETRRRRQLEEAI